MGCSAARIHDTSQPEATGACKTEHDIHNIIFFKEHSKRGKMEQIL